ncbi:hypothetical protein BH683_006260 [Williamsia sp. 1138]|uniref:hypothetical protein n=1 Tax=Williamsia sp. 1138 TaxID=1903117 RepID=UPI000A0FB72B|nr:hypothetical protein [Williamsia sp. 1138]OZG29987.1 hypothetical protein BH683_006260 [Williamsia sp. 1138]
MRFRQQRREDASTIIGMQSRGAVVVAALLLLGYLVTTLGTLEQVRSVWPLVAGFLVLAAGMATLLFASGDPLPLRPALVIAAAPTAMFVLVLPVLAVPLGNSLQLGPPLGGSVVLCSFMCVRGRVRLAWLALGGSFVVLAVWGATTGQGPLIAVGQGLGNVAVMLMATFFAYLLRPAAAAIYELRAQSVRQVAVQAAAKASRTERDLQLDRLNTLARPLLEPMVNRTAMTDGQLAEAALVEARLRDGIRARSLAGPVVTAAAWAARARGVRVVLLDDGGLVGAGDSTRTRLTEAVARHLDDAVDGEVTVRVQPPGRPVLVTVIVDTGAQVVRHSYSADTVAAR